MPADLIRRIRAGDVAAFEEAFRELHAPLCEVAYGYVRSQEAAEEIVQDLFFVVWIRRETLKSISLRAYLFRSVRNRALHYLRHQSVVRRFGLLVDSHPEVAGIALVSEPVGDTLDTDERTRSLRLAIDKLPVRTRLAVILRLDHQMSHLEVAQAMGISAKGVEKLLSQAKLRLRELLGDEVDLAR